MTPLQFPYVLRNASLGNVSLAPILPLTLEVSYAEKVDGLVDSGAAINVLPLSIGVALGLIWSDSLRQITLTGNLATVEAKAVLVSAAVGSFVPTRLVFAWAKTDQVSVILGQINFFAEYDVCFFRSKEIFEIRPNQH